MAAAISRVVQAPGKPVRVQIKAVALSGYRFCDYKDKVIDLLARVTTVSVETVKLVQIMKKSGR